MFNHILIPAEIGNSDTYTSAIKAATSLLNEGGKISLLHVVEPIPTYVETYIPPDFSIKSRTEVQTQLDSMAKDLGMDNGVVVFGGAGRSIVDWAAANNADCIVVTSHKPEFSDFFLGSTAAWVVRHAKTNIMVLR